MLDVDKYVEGETYFRGGYTWYTGTIRRPPIADDISITGLAV